jgi:hypothetical protein
LQSQISEAHFSSPSWISAGAKNLITRILDPNPTTVSILQCFSIANLIRKLSPFNLDIFCNLKAHVFFFENATIEILFLQSLEPYFNGKKYFIILTFLLLVFFNGEQRITIAQILEDPWFKKGYKPPVFDEKYQTSLDDVDAAFGDSEVSQTGLLLC